MSGVTNRVQFTGPTWLPSGEVRDCTLVFEGDTLAGVRSASAGEPRQTGLLVPGLINAHAHLELSAVGLVDGGRGLPTWVRRQFAQRGRTEADPDAPLNAARAMVAAGTAAVSDVAGGPSTAGVLAEAGLAGVVQRERLGQDPERRDAGIAEAPGLWNHPSAAVWERPAAHAPYSTHPDLARALLAGWGAAAGSVHLAEDAAERTYLMGGAGPFAELLDDLGVSWDRTQRFDGPVDWLDAVGALGPKTLAVHGVHLTQAECRRLAVAGTALALCVRSNLHIGGVAPPLESLVRHGVRLALGTDGLVSCPDLDVLAELPVLARLAPDVPIQRWLAAATHGGADALGLSGFGRLQVGLRPGLLQLDGGVDDLGRAPPDRRWLVRPGVHHSPRRPDVGADRR